VKVDDAVVGEVAVGPPCLGGGRDGGVIVLREGDEGVEVDFGVEVGVAGEGEADQDGGGVNGLAREGAARGAEQFGGLGVTEGLGGVGGGERGGDAVAVPVAAVEAG